MGLHLIAGTFNQAALARGRAVPAAAAWLLCAVAFVGWVASTVVSDEVLRVETGYFGATLLLSAPALCAVSAPGAVQLQRGTLAAQADRSHDRAGVAEVRQHDVRAGRIQFGDAGRSGGDGDHPRAGGQPGGHVEQRVTDDDRVLRR